MDKYIGRLLDNRYEILEVIGTGGMAVVYKARCHRLNRLVAIKILKDDYLEDEDFRARFHAESQAVAMLSHPNIVQVYDVSSSIMADYIVMELVDGITLKQYMEKKGVLNWKETLHFAIQIAKALEHAHSRGIVHRDIKPHNIMVLKNGSVKVADFGIARMMSEGNTLTKEALGSVHYISPEQARGGRIDTRSDLYSLGVVMYEMMAGRPPYDGDSPVAVAIAHINGGAPMPSTFNPNIPGGLEQIIMKAMAHDLSDRYPTATRMLADMDEFRKDPTILFDYNTPPLDVVTTMPRPAAVQTPPTTAQRVVQRESGERPPKQPPRPQRPARPRSEERRREQEENKRNRAATTAIIACSVVAMIAVVVFLVNLFNGGAFQNKEQLVKVPHLVGEVYDALPKYPDFSIMKNEAYDENVPEGCIIDQTPKADEEVVKDRVIVVTVSLGPTPRVVTMKNLENVSLDQAISILDSLEMNLVYDQKLEYSDTIMENNVIRTEPAKGEELTTGQTITLYLSKGQEIRVSSMPGLIEQSESAARRILDNLELDLRITTEEVYDSMIPSGQIVRTEPEKGGELKTGQFVKLYISKGAEQAKMPNVLDMDIQKAVNLVRTAGFNTPEINYVDSDKPKDVVVNQSLDPNAWADVTANVVLEISKGPVPETTVPAPTNPPLPTVPETVGPTAPSAEAVTQDVVLTVSSNGTGLEAESTVVVMLEGREIYNQKVPAGTQTISLPHQSGKGTLVYEISINGQQSFYESVPFGSDGD